MPGAAASAALQIFPSLRGFEATLSRQLQAGVRGSNLDALFKSAFLDVGTVLAHEIHDGAQKGAHGLDTELAEAGRKGGKEAGEGIAKGLEGAKDKAKDLLGDLGIGATVVGAFAGAMTTVQNRGVLQAKLGLSPEDAKALGATSGKIYADNWGESTDQINETLTSLVQQAHFKPDDAGLQDTAEKVLALSQTFQTEGPAISNAIGQMVGSGMAGNAQEALDIITNGFQQGDDKAGDFLDTINEYSTQFRKLGIGGGEATNLISQGLKANARDGDLVADAIKEFSIRSVDGSASSAEGFKALGLDAAKTTAIFARGGAGANKEFGLVLEKLKAIKDPAARGQAAVQLFGTQAEDLGAALFALDPAAASSAGALDKVNGATDRMESAIGSTASPIDSLKRQIAGVFTEIGGNALPILQPFLTLMANSGKPIAYLAVAIGSVAAVSKGVILVTRLWTTAQTALNIVMSANPIGLVVLALAALVLGFIYAYKHSETFRRVVTESLHAVEAGFKTGLAVISKTVGAIKRFFSGDTFKSGAAAAGKGLLLALGGPLPQGVALYRHFHSQINSTAASGWHAVAGITSRGVDTSARIARGIGSKIGNLDSAINSRYRHGFATVRGAVASAMTSTYRYVSGIPGHIASSVGDLSSTLYNSGRELIQGLENGIQSKIGDVLGSVGGLGSSILGKLGGVLDIHSPSRKAHALGEFFGVGFGDGIGSTEGYVGDKAGGLGNAAMSKVNPGWSSTADARATSRVSGAAAGGVVNNHHVDAPVTVHSKSADGRVVGSEVSRQFSRLAVA